MASDRRCTYRLQLNSDFTLDDAASVLPYLSKLGISHLYLSPILRATSESTHGYDVVDHSLVDPKIGGEEALQRLVTAARGLGISILLDIVPNHMAIGSAENRWWWDVLEFGPSSRFASFFDVDWDPPESKLKNKILLPVLGDHYGRTLEKGEITVIEHEGRPVAKYGDSIFPLNEDSLTVMGEAHGLDRHQLLVRCNQDPDVLHGLLELQHYRLSYWRASARDLGYRRFFDINSLVGLRVEEPEVFEAVHARVLEWVDEDLLDGLRIDHIDGLYDPKQYLDQLRERIGGAWLLVEKILEGDERLPSNWPVDGTTGYDFADLALRSQLDPVGLERIRLFYRKITEDGASFEETAASARHQVLSETLASDLNNLTGQLVDLCEGHREFRDLTRHELHEALREVMVSFDVYRTYVRPEADEISPNDRRIIDGAVEAAASLRPELTPEVFDLIRQLLTLEKNGPAEARFVARFQQLSSAVMAKGLEDTTFYRYVAFIALNEVGSSPVAEPLDAKAIHAEGLRRSDDLAHSMLATSTHDTKRGEDVRARLAALTEIPDRWIEAVQGWMKRVAPYRHDDVPETEMVYLILQTLIGAHPIDRDRLWEYVLKAAREAKRFTSWTAVDEPYEKALENFVDAVLSDAELIVEVEDLVSQVRDPGLVNSLAMCLMKLTFPGVPDIYQGSEMINFSLVDPDNRRPVDYALHSAKLEELVNSSAERAWSDREAGDAKLFLIHRALRVRREHPDAYDPGSTYSPLDARGPFADRVIGWLRGEKVAVVIPSRGATVPDWLETSIQLPDGEWADQLSGVTVRGEILLNDLLRSFPVALLVRT